MLSNAFSCKAWAEKSAGSNSVDDLMALSIDTCVTWQVLLYLSNILKQFAAALYFGVELNEGAISVLAMQYILYDRSSQLMMSLITQVGRLCLRAFEKQ